MVRKVLSDPTSPPPKRIPWYKQEVEGSKMQILASKASSKVFGYLLLLLLYGVFTMRWWALAIVVPGILIAVVVQSWPSKRPLSILDTGSEKPKKKERDSSR